MYNLVAFIFEELEMHDKILKPAHAHIDPAGQLSASTRGSLFKRRAYYETREARQVSLTCLDDLPVYVKRYPRRIALPQTGQGAPSLIADAGRTSWQLSHIMKL